MYDNAYVHQISEYNKRPKEGNYVFMKKMFFKKSWLWAIVLCMLAVFAPTRQVEAAEAGIVSFELYEDGEDTCSKYDVTGDKIQDTVKVTVKNNQDDSYSGTLQVYVNGNLVFKQTREPDPIFHVNLIQLKNGKIFFDIESTIFSDDACIHNLYVYSKGKLKNVYDFQEYFANYASYYTVNIVNVSGNTLKTEVRAQFHTTGIIRYNMKVAYKNGTLKRTSNTYSINYDSRTNKWTVGRTIKAYKSAGSKKLAFTLKKGNSVQLNKVVYKNNKVYFQVKRSNGKTGYIPAIRKYPYPQYFVEAQYAG